MLRCYAKHIAAFGFTATVMVGCVSGNLSSEDKREWLRANEAFDNGDYLNAQNIYQKLYQKDSTQEEINYKLGVSIFKLDRNRPEALRYFKNVSPVSYLEVEYYRGLLYHQKGEYMEAIKAFNNYMKAPGFKMYTNAEIKNKIEKAETAPIFIKNEDQTVAISNLGASVNSKYAEYAPVIPAEENIMYFTSRRGNEVFTAKDILGEYFEDIYYTKYMAGQWHVPEMLHTNINTELHDACTGISADGQNLLVFRTSEDLRTGNIFESEFLPEGWSDPKKLNTNVNSNEHPETSACYSPDKQMIFFSSDRPGGYGGKDLYFVRRLPNGDWGEPFNLGPGVNTPFNEHAPFVHPSGKFLFFSSEGHENMGGYDLFKAEFNEAGTFTKPKNLGYPINTVGDDVYFVMNTDGSAGYFSSDRKGGLGDQDLYKVQFDAHLLPLDVFTIHVMHKHHIINDVDIVLRDEVSGKVYGKYKSNENTGKIIIIATPGSKFEMEINADGYEDKKKTVVLDEERNITYALTPKI